MIAVLAASTRVRRPGTRASNEMLGWSLPSPAWNTLLTVTWYVAAIRPMVSSTSGRAERGTTASCTTRSRERRPIAPNAFFRPCHRRSRSPASAATRIDAASWLDSSSWTVSVSRSEEHTSELQSQSNLVCRLLLQKKKIKRHTYDRAGFTHVQSAPSYTTHHRPHGAHHRFWCISICLNVSPFSGNSTLLALTHD